MSELNFLNNLYLKKYKLKLKKIKKNIGLLSQKTNEELRGLICSKQKIMAITSVFLLIKNILKIELYDVQLISLLAMLDGNFVDVKTGEGKTVIIGAYCLLTEKPIHIVTVNDFLAQDGLNKLKKIYDFCGFTSIALEENSIEATEGNMNYDIIYGTASSFAFRYITKRYTRNIDYELNIAVVDEADYVLIDNATSSFNVGVQTPETNNDIKKISSGKEFSNYLKKTISSLNKIEINFDEFSKWNNISHNFMSTVFYNKTLKFVDFSQDVIDNVLEQGMSYDMNPAEIISYLYGVTEALFVFEKNVDYIVKEDKVVLVDKHNGRLLPNSKHEIYLNLALDIKEETKDKYITKNIGTIANQVYFLKYRKVIGLSGSLYPVRKEIGEIFKTNTIKIPKNKNSKIKKEYFYCETKKEKYDILLDIINNRISKTDAVLIICKNDKESQDVNNFLIKNGKTTNLFNNELNGFDVENEIIKKAGEKGVITVSTLLFGRGTDIIPNDNVVLNIIMLEEFGCERASVQIFGRTGRQGRDGVIYTITSKEDEIFNYLSQRHKITKKNYLKLIKKAINYIYSINVTAREKSTYYAYYENFMYDVYYSVIMNPEYDDYFLEFMEDMKIEIFKETKREENIQKMLKSFDKKLKTIKYLTKGEL